MSWAEGSPVYPSYPGRANFSYILLHNVAKRLHENQKVGLARVTPHLARSPFCGGRQGHPPTTANFSTLFFFFFFSYLGFVCLFVCLQPDLFAFLQSITWYGRYPFSVNTSQCTKRKSFEGYLS